MPEWIVTAFLIALALVLACIIALICYLFSTKV
jgi:hypothetical protein